MTLLIRAWHHSFMRLSSVSSVFMVLIGISAFACCSFKVELQIIILCVVWCWQFLLGSSFILHWSVSQNYVTSYSKLKAKPRFGFQVIITMSVILNISLHYLHIFRNKFWFFMVILSLDNRNACMKRYTYLCSRRYQQNSHQCIEYRLWHLSRQGS